MKKLTILPILMIVIFVPAHAQQTTIQTEIFRSGITYYTDSEITYEEGTVTGFVSTSGVNSFVSGFRLFLRHTKEVSMLVGWVRLDEDNAYAAVIEIMGEIFYIYYLDDDRVLTFHYQDLN